MLAYCDPFFHGLLTFFQVLNSAYLQVNTL